MLTVIELDEDTGYQSTLDLDVTDLTKRFGLMFSMAVVALSRHCDSEHAMLLGPAMIDF